MIPFNVSSKTRKRSQTAYENNVVTEVQLSLGLVVEVYEFREVAVQSSLNCCLDALQEKSLDSARDRAPIDPCIRPVNESHNTKANGW